MEAPQIPSESSMDDGQKDVWSELFGVVQGLAETVDLALQAFTPGDDKVRWQSVIDKSSVALIVRQLLCLMG